MVNVKSPYLVHLEIESMEILIEEYKRYAQNCLRPLLRTFQQFVLEEHLDINVKRGGLSNEAKR
jgi:hypothetical protein